MINKVILTGRLTSDVELRKTNDGTSYVFFTIAVNRRNSDGTDFINCAAWRNTAEVMNQYLKKGSLIGVEGRLEVFTQQRDGRYDTRTTVQVSNLDFLETKSQADQRTAENRVNYNQPSQSMEVEQPMSFANETVVDQSVSTPFTNSFSEPEITNANDINLDDIKF